jgi:hypothetical protein
MTLPCVCNLGVARTTIGILPASIRRPSSPSAKVEPKLRFLAKELLFWFKFLFSNAKILGIDPTFGHAYKICLRVQPEFGFFANLDACPIVLSCPTMLESLLSRTSDRQARIRALDVRDNR